MSPAAAASAAVAARARGPSSLTRSVRVSGPRLLLSTTSWPASTASRAMVLPMFPLPMSPMVVTYAASRAPAEPFPARSHPGHARDGEPTGVLDHVAGDRGPCTRTCTHPLILLPHSSAAEREPIRAGPAGGWAEAAR